MNTSEVYYRSNLDLNGHLESLKDKGVTRRDLMARLRTAKVNLAVCNTDPKRMERHGTDKDCPLTVTKEDKTLTVLLPSIGDTYINEAGHSRAILDRPYNFAFPKGTKVLGPNGNLDVAVVFF